MLSCTLNGLYPHVNWVFAEHQGSLILELYSNIAMNHMFLEVTSKIRNTPVPASRRRQLSDGRFLQEAGDQEELAEEDSKIKVDTKISVKNGDQGEKIGNTGIATTTKPKANSNTTQPKTT